MFITLAGARAARIARMSVAKSEEKNQCNSLHGTTDSLGLVYGFHSMGIFAAQIAA